MKKRPLLLVEWVDTTGGSGWENENREFAKKLITTYTVGWKLKSDRKTLVITGTRNSVEDCSDRNIIPRGCVRSIRRLE